MRFIPTIIKYVTQLLLLCSVLFILFSMVHAAKINSSIKTPQNTNIDLLFWDPSTWKWDNFVVWDWRRNVDKMIDTPVSAIQFWYSWVKNPYWLNKKELLDNTTIYIDIALESIFLYNKGVLMEVQGLVLQHKYGKAISRLLNYLGGFFFDFWRN